MLAFREDMRKITEKEDSKIQKLAYDLFQHLVTRNLTPGSKIPEFDGPIRREFTKNIYLGTEEFTQSVANYLNGYLRIWVRDEQKHKSDFGSKWIAKAQNKLQ